MKVIHLVTEDCYGAGRAAQRISNALNSKIESRVFVLRKLSKEDVDIISIPNNLKFAKRVFQKLNEMEISRFSTGNLFHIEKWGINFKKFLDVQKPDIIHLHYINDGIFSYSFMKEIKKRGIPIVWTLHDMWPFTGGCHYDKLCGQYKEKCADCKQLNSKTKPAKALINKSNIYGNITWVGCSTWISDEFNKSYIGMNSANKCKAIPNPIDSRFYSPYERENNSDKKIILFGAVNALRDERKGFKYLADAIKLLNKNEYKLIYFGDNLKCDSFKGFETESLGYISHDEELIKIYRRADVFVASSTQENLANTVMEALACGTPTVTFAIGGMGDMIQNGINGYLTKCFDETELAHNIEMATMLKSNYIKIQQTVISKFSDEIVCEKYLTEYKKVLGMDLK